MTLAKFQDLRRWFDESFGQRLARRRGTMLQALVMAEARGALRVVETGCARQAGNWAGDGQSTIVFGAFVERVGGRLWTCDVSAASMAAARSVTAARWGERIEYVVEDSVSFLTRFDGQIDLLYLDSWDFDVKDPGPAQAHALAEARAAAHALHDWSVVVVDDCDLPHGGKGGKVVPYLLGDGWELVGFDYQAVLVRGWRTA